MKNVALVLLTIAVGAEGFWMMNLNRRLNQPFRADLEGVAQIMVCLQPVSQGQILFGMANDCHTIAQKGMAKVVIQSVTANHGVLTLYQRAAQRVLRTKPPFPERQRCWNLTKSAMKDGFGLRAIKLNEILRANQSISWRDYAVMAFL